MLYLVCYLGSPLIEIETNFTLTYYGIKIISNIQFSKQEFNSKIFNYWEKQQKRREINSRKYIILPPSPGTCWINNPFKTQTPLFLRNHFIFSPPKCDIKTTHFVHIAGRTDSFLDASVSHNDTIITRCFTHQIDLTFMLIETTREPGFLQVTL